MEGNEYIVPLGVDSKTILAGFDEITAGVDKVSDKAGQAGRTIEEAFGKGAAASDKFEEALKPTTRVLEQVSEISKRTGRDLSETFDVKKSSDKFARDISDFKKRLSEVTGKRTIGLEIDKSTIKDLQDATNYLKNNFDQIQTTFSSAIQFLDKNIDETKAGIKETEQYMKDLQDQIEGMAPSVNKLEMETELKATSAALKEDQAALADYENSIKEIEGAQKNLAKTLAESTKAVDELADSQSSAGSSLNEVGAGTDQVVTKSKSLKTELREIKAALQAMELAGEESSQKFLDMSIRAGQLEDQIGDTNAQIRTLASDSKYLDATVSGVTGLVGAFTLAQGAVGLFGAENEELNEVLLKVNSAMAVLQGLQAVADTLNKDSAFSVIFLRNARLQDVTATEAQTVATTGQAAATRGATLATRGLGVALKAIGIGLIIALIAFLIENWDKLKEAINKVLPAGENVGKMFDKIKSIAVGVGNVVFQYLIMPFRALSALLSGNLTEFKNVILDGFNFKKNFTDGFNAQETRNEKAHQKELEEARIEADARDLTRRKNRGENVEKQEIELQKRRVALQEKDSKEYKTNLETLEDLQDKHYKSMTDAQIKAAEEAKKKRDEAAKKALEDQKKVDAQTAAYTRSIADIRIAAIANEGERERAKINEEYRRKLEDLKNDAALNADLRAQQGVLELEIEAEKGRKIKELDAQIAKDQIAMKLEANEALANLAKEGTARDLLLLNIDHQKRLAEINEKYKDEEELRTMLIQSLNQSTAREEKKIRDEGAQKALQDEEERQLLAIELASKYAVKNENTERQKQIAILETKVEFADKALQLLLAGGASESSLEVQRAKKVIKDLRDALDSEIKANKGKGFDFLEFIGLGDISDEQREALQKAGQQAGQAVAQITDFIVSQYDRQIKKKQESIDQLDEDVDTLEGQLDEEKELREQGFANNVEMIEQELADKKEAREQELKDQEELVKKKQAMQKAQMAVDTAVQLVNMVTASTEIFKSLAGIPFVGVPLAIGLIATMFGGFALAKVKAFQAINDQSQFGEGGWIDAPSHAQGGKKYYSPDGAVRELEGGEFVIKKKQAGKFSKMLESINSGQFSALDINDAGLGEILAGMGISFAESSSRDALRESREADGMKVAVTVNSNANEKELKEMNESLRFMAQRERERIVTWEDDLYFYKKEGSRVTKILKVKPDADTKK